MGKRLACCLLAGNGDFSAPGCKTKANKEGETTYGRRARQLHRWREKVKRRRAEGKWSSFDVACVGMRKMAGVCGRRDARYKADARSGWGGGGGDAVHDDEEVEDGGGGGRRGDGGRWERGRETTSSPALATAGSGSGSGSGCHSRWSLTARSHTPPIIARLSLAVTCTHSLAFLSRFHPAQHACLDTLPRALRPLHASCGYMWVAFRDDTDM